MFFDFLLNRFAWYFDNGPHCVLETFEGFRPFDHLWRVRLHGYSLLVKSCISKAVHELFHGVVDLCGFIPFAVSDNLDWIGKRDFDLVIASDWAPAELKGYVENGGRVLIASPREPELQVARVISRSKDVKGYFRVRNHGMFPSLKDTDLLLLDGPFTKVEGDESKSLSLIPTSMIGPPEFIHINMQDTDKPGIVYKELGRGQVAWLPWDLGALYYRVSLPAYAALFHDVIDRLYPKRQLTTNAHPLVEITWMKQGSRNLLHLINLSGHSQTGYFAPLKMSGIRIEVAGQFKTATTIRDPHQIPTRMHDGYTVFTIPELADYELVVLK